MAFFKYARATIVKPEISGKYWKNRTASSPRASKNIISQASEILGKEFNPNDYLFSHATIVCSVDVQAVPNMRMGNVVEEGSPIKRLYSDYRITPETQKYINDNNDAWSRGVIKKSYGTYIGADNFVEHVQKAEESKGKVLDVAVRDIGESLYVDILIATDRRHADLIQKIMSKEIQTLSMGCVADFTICTKCGNVASDETQLCPCIRYSKGTTFLDEKGQKQVVAELCGHETQEPNGGNKFIEASWVENPAFKGAVLRNLLNYDAVKDTPNVESILAQPPSIWVEPSKVASLHKHHSVSVKAEDWGSFDFGGDSGNSSNPSNPGADGGKEEPKPKSELDKIDEEISQYFVNKMTTKLKKQMDEALDKDKSKDKGDSMKPNDNVIKEASMKAIKAYIQASKNLSNEDFIKGLNTLYSSFGKDIKDVSRVAYKVASLNKVSKEQIKGVIRVFKANTGRIPTKQEFSAIIELSRILLNRKS